MSEDQDPGMVVHREPIAAWVVGPGRAIEDDGPAGSSDFEIVAVVTSAATEQGSHSLPVVDLRAPAASVDETGTVHMTAHEAVVIARQIIEAAQVAIERVRSA